MEEKSGIEMLKEILVKLDEMDKRLKILETNIKNVANSAKLSDLVSRATEAGATGWTQALGAKLPSGAGAVMSAVGAPKDIGPKTTPGASGFKNFSFESNDASKQPGAKQIDKRNLRTPVVPNGIMVKGKMVKQDNGKEVPLSNISVKVFDANDTLIKTTKTNRAGRWMCLLPSSASYVALFEGSIDGKKLTPQNRNFEVPSELKEGQKFIEIL